MVNPTVLLSCKATYSILTKLGQLQAMILPNLLICQLLFDGLLCQLLYHKLMCLQIITHTYIHTYIHIYIYILFNMMSENSVDSA